MSLLQAVFDSAPNSICVFRILYDSKHEVEDFEILMFNAFTERITGLTKNQAIGRRYSKVFPTTITTGVFQRFKEAATTGEQQDFEQWYEGEGMQHWFRFIVIKQGGLLVATTEDITARKKAEQELAEEHYFLEQVTDNTPHLIYVFDLFEQRFIYVNRRIQELAGIQQEYVYGMGLHIFKKIVLADDVGKAVDYYSGMSTLKEGEMRELEIRLLVGEDYRWFCLKSHVFKKDDKAVRQVIGMAEDITYEKLLREKVDKEQRGSGLN